MLIEDIVPYERNAHVNKDNVPKIADSIREFGFMGQIVLESRENPVIVAGHHRVEACRLLGWTEIPDENIAWCDHLNADQVKALRLADNRLGEGRWNRAMLKREVRELARAGIDMSRFSFDFKSKVRRYGAERRRTDDKYNLAMVNRSHTAGELDMPTIEGCDFVPSALLAFNYAKTATETDQTLHFFIDDYQFERIWNKPGEYLGLVSQFEAALTPDFSLYMDMPLPLQRYNEYRRRALGNYWQRNGVTVIPTLSWSDERSYDFCFGGLPMHATYATSTVGVKRDAMAMETWRAGMSAAIDALQPRRIILYGGAVNFDFGDIEVIEYAANAAFGGK